MDKRWYRSEQGQAMVEYALLFVLVALFVIGGFTLLSSTMGNVLQNLVNFMASPN